MKRYIFACLGALLAPCTATAQQWTQTDNAGTRVAAIVADTSELRVTCAPAGAGIQNALTLRLAGTPANGPVEFTFDNSTAVAAFTNGQLLADQQTNAALFAEIIRSLRNDNAVQVADAAGTSSAFSLSGSGNAIGTCPLPEVTFALENCQTARGLAYVRNGTGIALGDICADRANGAVAGAFTTGALTQDSDDGTTTTFTSDAARLDIAPELTSPYHAGRVADASPALAYNDGEISAVGFLYGPLSGAEALEETFFATIRSDEIGLIGVAEFADGTATFAVGEDPAAGTTQTGGGSVTLTVDADGAVTGSGTLDAQTETETLSLRIDTLRGFAVGETGQVIKAFAVASGQATDANGAVRDVTQAVEIFLFATTIWDE